MKKFSERFKELRKDRKVSLIKLSSELNIAISTLSRWENGKTDITGENLILLAQYFKVSTDYLLGLED